MAGLSPKTAARTAAIFLPVLLGLVFLPGCNPDDYPADLSYPLRSDPIVDQGNLPTTPITYLDPPGTLEQWIDTIPERGGKILDPHAVLQKQQLQLSRINEYIGRSHFDLSADEARDVGLGRKPENAEAGKTALEARRDLLKKVAATMNPTGPLYQALAELFGTPAEPKIALTDADGDPIEEPNLEPATLKTGAKLYRRHCLHCHGLTGDGRGPTGPWVNPHPRDYRLGEFKFTSTSQGTGTRKARRSDLLRTLKMGIEGTSMPSFALLDEQKELEPLISYVIHLSLRGQVELEMDKALLGGDSEGADDVLDDVKGSAQTRLGRIWKQGWVATEKKPIKINAAEVPPYAGKPLGELSAGERAELEQSIRRGFNQFTTGTGQCRLCHNDFGRANDYKYDDWGTIVRPANLTAGQYRGGRRPLDLYYRIHSGINGSRMPAFDDALQPQQIWDVVNFLEAMPFPKMLPEDVRDQVYGKK